MRIDIALELVRTGLSLIILFVTWILGQFILAFWEAKKKRKELDLTTSAQFFKLCGEFYTIWRLWKLFVMLENEKLSGHNSPYQHPENSFWDLLERATSAEGAVESILIRLATERQLDDATIKTLGLFRQAYQQVRQGIRDKRRIEWKRESPEYILFKDLSTEISCFINYKGSFRQKPIDKEMGKMQLKQITAIDSKAWEANVAMLKTSNKAEKTPFSIGPTNE